MGMGQGGILSHAESIKKIADEKFNKFNDSTVYENRISTKLLNLGFWRYL
jgi:hypothetical protein